MGFALAQALHEAGAVVTLISGPVNLQTPTGVHRVDVTTAQEMANAVTSALDSQAAALFIGVAAVADWRPKAIAADKLKKDSGGNLAEIEWIENPDILAMVAKRSPAPFCVGFAAESGTQEDLKTLLPRKRARKQVPLLVGNVGPDTFGADENQILLCDEQGLHPLPPNSKINLARILVFEIAKRLSTDGSTNESTDDFTNGSNDEN